MKIRDLNLEDYVIVYDIGKSENSEGMMVVGRVDEIIFNEDDKNEAVIDSVGELYTVTDENYFDNWQDHMARITESVSGKKSNDVQQRKRFEHLGVKLDEITPNDMRKLVSGTKKQNDTVNHPSHYNYGEIEVIDYCDQVCKQYPPELAPYVFNAIKYLSRANHKNGREDIDKAKFYVQRLFDKWE